jgi:ElaB/YqjD/DUF883 family membrane-anchored ribosome-binding protein
MDSTADRELEMIRADAHQTRAQLADKLEALESQVSQTVAGVTSAVETVSHSVAGVTSAVESVASTVTDTVANVTGTVSNTVQNMTETVSNTVQTVTHSLDVSPRIQEHPWASVGCAFAAGFAGGYLSGSSRAEGAPPPPPYTPPAQSFSSPEASHNGSGQSPTYAAVTDAVSEIGGAVRSLGISALMGVVTHLARTAVPEALRSDVCGAMEKLKTRLGGHHDVPAELFETKK